MLPLLLAVGGPQQHLLTEYSDNTVFSNAETAIYLQADYRIEEKLPVLGATFYGGGHKILCDEMCFESIFEATIMNTEFVTPLVANTVGSSLFINVTFSGMLANTVEQSRLSFIAYAQQLAVDMKYTELHNTTFAIFPVIEEATEAIKLYSSQFIGSFNGFCILSGSCRLSVLENNMIKMVAGPDSAETPLFGEITDFEQNDVYTSGQVGALFGSVGTITSSRFEIIQCSEGMLLSANELYLKKSTLLIEGVAVTTPNGLYAKQNLVLESAKLYIANVLLNSPDSLGLFSGLLTLKATNSELIIDGYEIRDFADEMCLLAKGARLIITKSHINVSNIVITKENADSEGFSLIFSNQGDNGTANIEETLFSINELEITTPLHYLSLLGDNLGFFSLESVEVVLTGLELAKMGDLSLSCNGVSQFDGENYFVNVDIEELSLESQFYGLGEIGSFHKAVFAFELPDEFTADDQALMLATATGADVFIEVTTKAGFIKQESIITNILIYIGEETGNCHICQPNSLYPEDFRNFTVTSDADFRVFYSTVEGICAEGSAPCRLPVDREKCDKFGCLREYNRYNSDCGSDFICISPYIIIENLIEYYDYISICEFGFLQDNLVCSEDCAAFAFAPSGGSAPCNNYPESEAQYNAICREGQCECNSVADVYNPYNMVCDAYCPDLNPQNGVCISYNNAKCFINYQSVEGDYKCNLNYCDSKMAGAECIGYANTDLAGEFYCSSLFGANRCYPQRTVSFCQSCAANGRGLCVYGGDKQSYEITEQDVSCDCTSDVYSGAFCEHYQCKNDEAEVCGGLGDCANNACKCQKTAYLDGDGMCQLGCDGSIIFYGECRGNNAVLCYGSQEAALDLVAVNCGDCRLSATDPCGAGSCEQGTGSCLCDSGNYLNSEGICIEVPDCGLGKAVYDEESYEIACKCSALQQKQNGICVRSNLAIVGIVVPIIVVIVIVVVVIVAILIHKKRMASIAQRRQQEGTLNQVYFEHTESVAVAHPE